MHITRTGAGRPLLLIHGLGGSHRSWDTILAPLAAEREVVAVDLPGFGATPPLAGPTTIATLADALERLLDDGGLDGVDVAGSSMGARLALELARRRRVGATVALDPGGFWSAGEQRVFGASIAASIRLVRALQPAMPALTGSPAGRTVMFGQLSPRPWALPGGALLQEMRDYATAERFDEALRDLASGPMQEGAPVAELRGPVTLVWGRRDLVTLPRQARRAVARFPGAELLWLDRCGHFPQWDRPDAAARIILSRTGG